MLPVIAIVGRPNVGKSTLFNRLTKTRDALVADRPGVTRDRQYGQGQLDDQAFIVIDTGGITGQEQEGLDALMAEQVQHALNEADVICFVVDGVSGLVAADNEIAIQLRRLNKPTFVAVNKTDGLEPQSACAEFYGLGFSQLQPIAAAHNRGVVVLTQALLAQAPQPSQVVDDTEQGIRLAIIGRPNVGKSTLVNRILGEERVVVYDMPGTTRDSVEIPMQRDDHAYTLIDTAGVRRRSKVSDHVEKFSVIKTLQAINQANVVIMVLNARESVVEQDLHLLDYAIDAGKALVIAVNKWDGMTTVDRTVCKTDLKRRLHFADFARMHFISALHGTGVGELFASVQEAYACATREFSASERTKILEDALLDHNPPLVRGRRVKPRYAHVGGHNPPIIVIHGNQVDALPDSYKRYLINVFRQVLKLVGTPIRIELRSGDNPYANKGNTLTRRQLAKKRRLMQHVKQKKKQEKNKKRR